MPARRQVREDRKLITRQRKQLRRFGKSGSTEHAVKRASTFSFRLYRPHIESYNGWQQGEGSSLKGTPLGALHHSNYLILSAKLHLTYDISEYCCEHKSRTLRGAGVSSVNTESRV